MATKTKKPKKPTYKETDMKQTDITEFADSIPVSGTLSSDNQKTQEGPEEAEGADRVDIIRGDEINRCRLCSDGGEGKPLLKAKDSMNQTILACQRHVGFYSRGNDTDLENRAIQRKLAIEQATARRDVAASVVEEEDGPTIKMKNR